MTPSWSARLLVSAAACAVAAALAPRPSAQAPAARTGVLDEHPAIRYAGRPATDRVAVWARQAAERGESIAPRGVTGYLGPLLDALGIPVESQVLVFSKTGVQRAFTNPHTPRALYFNDSVVVGYIPGAPALEIASHDPQQGVVFYTIDQKSATGTPVRSLMCLTCHVSATTLDVPGLIARSNFVDDDGNVLPRLGGHDVDHSTGHPDRWGGWFVTSVDGPPPYSQRAHQGNITFTPAGTTSNEVFQSWLNTSPGDSRYLLPTSDIVSLLAFDHQAHAINLMTRLNWEWRVAAVEGRAAVTDDAIGPLVQELADYLTYAGEAPMQAPLKAPAGLAADLLARYPRDRRGRSLAELELVDRFAKYPCSYMIYSRAFDALAAPVKEAIYRRIAGALSSTSPSRTLARVPAEDRRAALEIVKETKADFPQL